MLAVRKYCLCDKSAEFTIILKKTLLQGLRGIKWLYLNVLESTDPKGPKLSHNGPEPSGHAYLGLYDFCDAEMKFTALRGMSRNLPNFG